MNKRFANKDTGLIVATDFKTAKARAVYWMMFAFLIVVSFVISALCQINQITKKS